MWQKNRNIKVLEQDNQLFIRTIDLDVLCNVMSHGWFGGALSQEDLIGVLTLPVRNSGRIVM